MQILGFAPRFAPVGYKTVWIYAGLCNKENKYPRGWKSPGKQEKQGFAINRKDMQDNGKNIIYLSRQEYGKNRIIRHFGANLGISWQTNNT